MRRILLGLAAVMLALLALADTGAAQAGGQGRGRGTGQGQGPGGQGPAFLRDSLPGRGPIELLLVQRDSLALTAAQVKQLEQLDAELQQQNAPLVQSMLELRHQVQSLIGMHPRDMTPAQRQQFAQQAERARPIMQQLQDNNRRAMERVSELLTPEQKRRLRLRLQEGRLPDPGMQGH